MQIMQAVFLAELGRAWLIFDERFLAIDLPILFTGHAG